MIATGAIIMVIGVMHLPEIAEILIKSNEECQSGFCLFIPEALPAVYLLVIFTWLLLFSIKGVTGFLYPAARSLETQNKGTE
ncbi:hypothetical protein ES703_71853 [subsurface metagenome]